MTSPRTDHAVFSPEDYRWMRRALQVADHSLFLSNPNPRVGCILVRDGRWLAEGFTLQVGGPHAEICALQHAAEQGLDVRGATAYVTLEPCSHQGRTPPCADALVRAGIERVVVGLQDPNPRVSGRGIARLRNAGIRVDLGLLAAESLALNPGFCARMTRRTPWLWLKSAQSLDGRTALPDGRSKWLTGEPARADGHHWRARACLVLTGIGTVLADDPLLTVRLVDTVRQPVRAVLDSRFVIPESARILDGGPVWIFTTHTDAPKADRLAARNARVVALPADESGRVSLNALLDWLGAHEINEVHVEAGPRLQGALVAGGHVDEWLDYVAPIVLGEGRGLVSLPAPPASVSDAVRYGLVDVVQLGRDLRLHLRNAEHWQRLHQACGLHTDLPA